MPKLFGKDIPPIALVGVTVLAVWLVAGALQSPTTPPLAKKKGPAQKSSMVVVDYNTGDYKAQFASMTTTPGDVFRPLVGKQGDLDVKNQSIDNFSYSGMATLNQTAEGLLENSTTGEGDFVEAGQHWHQNWLVVSLSADAIGLRNIDTGEDTVLKAGSNEKATSSGAPRVAAGGNVPFNPAMVGQIGGDNNITIQPDPGNGTTINMGNGNNGGRRRGGGGGRGGGRRGGGGGGGNAGPQGD